MTSFFYVVSFAFHTSVPALRKCVDTSRKIFSLPLDKPSKTGRSCKQCEGKSHTKGRSRITVQTHMGSRGIVPAVVNLGSRQRRYQLHVPAALLPGKGPLKRKLDT